MYFSRKFLPHSCYHDDNENVCLTAMTKQDIRKCKQYTKIINMYVIAVKDLLGFKIKFSQ